MFGKKRIWQKPPVSAERPQPSPGTPGQALQGSVQVAFNQQLQQEMTDRRLGEDQRMIHLNRLEQRIKGQSVEFIEIKDHLQRFRNELTEKIGADVSTVSKHLSVLKTAGIVRDEKRGAQVYYSLKVPCILNFFGCVESVLKSSAKEQSALVK